MVQIPADIAQAEIDESLMNYRPVMGISSAGDPADIKAAVTALLKAKNPVIYAGQGILWGESSAALQQFAELTNVPVMTSNTGKSAFPENHPLALGTGGNTTTKMVRRFLDKADLVFGIGTSFTTGLASIGIPQGKTLIQCTIDERDLNKEHQSIMP